MIVPIGRLNFLCRQNFSDQTVEHDTLLPNSAAGLLNGGIIVISSWVHFPGSLLKDFNICMIRINPENGFFSKYQSGFRKSKSTNDHLFHLSQTIMESFNWGEHVIAAFLDVKKAFDNICTMDSGIKFISLICPPSCVGGTLTS